MCVCVCDSEQVVTVTTNLHAPSQQTSMRTHAQHPSHTSTPAISPRISIYYQILGGWAVVVVRGATCDVYLEHVITDTYSDLLVPVS